MKYWLLIFCLLFITGEALADCKDAVVLVHGNTGSSADWDNTYHELLARGYSDDEIFRPNWGTSCASCNNHYGSEETPVREAISAAISHSCSGKIDIIGHSMGVTLAIDQVLDLSATNAVDDFVGIAGALRGLHSCGYYPYNVYNSTCGYWGLSIGSPFLNSIYGSNFAAKSYSIKSWYDQVVCYGGCTVGGVHSSRIWNEDASYTFTYGHFGLQSYTSQLQVNLIE
ncbi:alpha/beta fold hydrolase [Kangiella shandongensis]|uniref:alpha/beta fold hydrolase n=1 Tax=Kangiella shandongensis TaxID=2763258 RepID=UPI001CBB2068|nr:alpha/beta fold hydrolase [Kangiella shandongensis]